MQITVAHVKALREKTGAGMMECKAALVEADGDFERAEEELKARGIATAKKREERETNEGRIFVARDRNHGAMVELRCETDFVSLNDEFVRLGQRCVEALLAGQEGRLADYIADSIAVIKENIVRGRSTLLEASAEEVLVDYVHGQGSFASIVKLACAPEFHGEAEPVAHELALHVVARGPRYVDPEDIPGEVRSGVEAKFAEELTEQGKPAELWPKIIEGRWAKYLRERCLMLQSFLKDENVTVAAWLEAASSRVGTPLRVSGFAYAGISDPPDP